MVVPSMAQPKESCECMYSPKAGQWEIDLKLGQGQFFNDLSGLYYLLPQADGSAIGLALVDDDYAEIAGLGNNYISSDLSTYALNTGSLNVNSLVNIAGIEARYFITNHIDINFSGAYNLNIQPHKNYVEGEYVGLAVLGDLDYDDPLKTVNKVGIGDIYSQKSILGAVTHSLMTQLGADWYFNVRNPRINPYLGVFGQFKMARIESYYPYTGQQTTYDVDASSDLKYEDIETYRSANRAGQLFGFGGGLTFGVDFSIMEGLILGIEVAPICYQYSLMQLELSGQDSYYAMNHNLSAFKYPQLKLGIRF